MEHYSLDFTITLLYQVSTSSKFIFFFVALVAALPLNTLGKDFG